MSAPRSATSRNRAASLQSGRSSNRGRTAEMTDFTMTPTPLPRYFEPTAATASMFLYAQGPSVVCCHHDTLTIERRFARHSHEVQLLAVDNHSEMGAGRFVVSYDVGQTAIVWDLMTGDEIARFASYEHLTAAAWMKSGNVAFGNSQGTIILFEPTTSEHVSARTIDQIAVTALAPAGDCRTFAIGYQNGQCLVATLQPRFTILHNLTTSRMPSPIVTLQWHASSPRQKSDMLASQTQDGDLKVWSVAKAHNANDPAKVVRALRRNEVNRPGPNWMGWSKNGRIIQYTDSETISWDVRTKHVTNDMIPTLEHVRGLAVYGPGATLFTMGPNNTVQQFDLNAPAIMVANVQHPANLLPPSPPVSIEEQAEKATTIASESEITFNPSDVGISESEEEYHSVPHGKDAYRGGPRHPDADESSVASTRSGLSGISSSRTPLQYQESVRSRGMSEKTYISIGESLAQGRQTPYKHSDMYSQSSLSTTSTRSHRRRPSRLRHEVADETPAESRVDDLFKFTRSRLSDIPYKPPMQSEQGRLTNDHLREQMLSTIFGWHKNIEDLIVDEMSRHPPGSSSRIMLGKWLGHVDQDLMTTSSESMTSSDWMMLALSGIGHQQASQHKLGRAYVTTLLEKGDVHAAATILIGMGDQNDAIEIYVSHKRYMEAVILTCLFFPSVWERQAAIIKRWGEWAVQHGQQDLAIRCFACSGQESTEPWASPSAAQLTFQNVGPSIGEVLSPPLSPPALNRGPQRHIGKNSALKLITSFENQGGKAKFFSQADDGQTPIAAGPTPIVESAVEREVDPTTAVIRPSNRSGFNTPTSSKSFASSAFGGRNPLPSIGESHKEAAAPASDKRSKEAENVPVGMSIQRAATASPMMMRDNKLRVTGGEAPMPSPDPRVAMRMQDAMHNQRNGSRSRMPEGLNLHLDSVSADDDMNPTSPSTSMASSARYHWPSRRRGPASVSSVTSASTNRSVRTTATGGRHLETYIHSLDAASDRRKNPRGRAGSRDRHGSRGPSEERGRTPVRTYPAKRSPTSPVPMSPEELGHLNSAKHSKNDPVGHRTTSKSRTSSRGGSRRPTRTPMQEEPGHTSSSPPPPTSAVPQLNDTEDEEDYVRAVEAQEKFRQRHNKSRGLATPGTADFPHELPQGRSRRTPSEGHQSQNQQYRGSSLEHMGDLKSIKEERQRKKEQAARELEQRRKELAKNSEAGTIPHPNDITPLPFRLTAVEMTPRDTDSPPRSRTAEPVRNTYGRGPTGSAQVGLPATPKAMRLVLDSEQSRDNTPSVPPIPASYAQGRSDDRQGSSPEKGPRESSQNELGSLTLLPSTVYQPPRGAIPRSMSAPIPDEPPNRAHRSGQSSRKESGRGKNGSGDLRNITEHKSPPSNFARRGSYDDQVPPPPPPAPTGPMLRELQHLAVPPPPPPAPLPHVAHATSSPGNAPGTIEVVMDDDEQPQAPPVPPPAPPMQSSTPIVVPSTEITVPVLPPPAPPSAKGHSRGRSATDNSLAGRISKATERLRSASRTRKDNNAYRSHKSPEPAPYESVLPQMTYGQMGMRSPPPGLIDPHNLPTGLNKSDLI